jgi:hypothetical protein
MRQIILPKRIEDLGCLGALRDDLGRIVGVTRPRRSRSTRPSSIDFISPVFT